MPELLFFLTLSIVRILKILQNTTLRKLDLFPSSGEKGKHLKKETDIVAETLHSPVFFRISNDGQSAGNQQFRVLHTIIRTL
jgi:hypothetical protein